MARFEGAVVLVSLTAGCSVLADFDEFVSPGEGCEAEEEVCDGADDEDCDGRVDEGFDTMSDPANCGGCGRFCVVPPNTTPVCNAGTCGIGCPEGHADCNEDPSDGCEADLGARETCGDCSMMCPPSEVCDPVNGCGGSCGDGRFPCNGSCLAVGLAPECGVCGGTCTFTCTGDGSGECVAPRSLALGGRSVCAVDALGKLVCWGRNGAGELAIAGGEDRSSPTLTAVVDLDVIIGGFRHFCARTLEGRLVCWGDNDRGQLGDPAAGRVSATPIDVGLAGVTRAGAGAKHSCAATGDTLYCWGDDTAGQVSGSPSAAPVEVPTRVQLPENGDIESLVAGGDGTQAGHTCAVVGTGKQVVCWGLDDDDQVSAGSVEASRDMPFVRVPGTETVRFVAAGARHTCGATDTSVLCWGSNNVGQQGIGSVGGGASASAVTEVVKDGPWDITTIRAGAAHTCVLLTNGTVHCWGSDRFGEIGNGGPTGTGELAPAPVQSAASVTPASFLSTGNGFTCVTETATDRIHCFGRNSLGELGIGMITADQSSPVPTLPAGPP